MTQEDHPADMDPEERREIHLTQLQLCSGELALGAGLVLYRSNQAVIDANLLLADIVRVVDNR